MMEASKVRAAARSLNDRQKAYSYEEAQVNIKLMKSTSQREETSINQRNEEKANKGKGKETVEITPDVDLKKTKANYSIQGGVCGWCSIKYYQQYFDVDTIDVQQRIGCVLWPFGKISIFNDILAERPDIYGPFWITYTLMFLLASCSNISSWIQWNKQHTTLEEQLLWTYDFNILMKAFTVVSIFGFAPPFILYIIGRSANLTLGLVSLICLYGYSFVVYIPAVLLCVLPMNGIDWISLLVAMSWSLVFVVRNLWEMLTKTISSEKLLPILFFLSASHLLFTMIVKLMFFS